MKYSEEQLKFLKEQKRKIKRTLMWCWKGGEGAEDYMDPFQWKIAFELCYKLAKYAETKIDEWPTQTHSASDE